MARVKGKSTTVNPFVVLAFFVASLLIAFIAYKFLTVMKEQRIESHTQELIDLANSYDLAEIEFSTQFSTVILSRTPLTEFEVSLLTAKYEDLLNKAKSYDPNSQYIERLTQRVTDMHLLTSINTILRTEHTIADSLDSYNACKNAISYKATAAKNVYSQLTKCSADILAAQESSRQLPTYLFSSSCKSTNTPDYIIQKVVSSHDLLVEYYNLLAQKKGPQAADVDYSYQAVVSELRTLPKWNYCITEYIEQQSTLFSPAPKERGE